MSSSPVAKWLGLALLATGLLVIVTPFAVWKVQLWQLRQEAERFEAARPAAGVADQAPGTGQGSAQGPAPGAGAAPPSAAAPAPVVPRNGTEYVLEIPAIGVKALVGEGIADADLLRGPGHYPSTPEPGPSGNAAIAGHRNNRLIPAVFWSLDKLKPGDPVLITYADRQLRYVVEQVYTTTTDDTAMLAPTPTPALTLTTCDPPGDGLRRLIVRAALTETKSAVN